MTGIGLWLKWSYDDDKGRDWRCMRDRGHSGPCAKGTDPAAFPPKDEIDKPQHYFATLANGAEVECRELCRSLALPFSLANVLKYLWRAGRKTPDKLKDLRKARAYLDWEIAALEREESGKGAP